MDVAGFRSRCMLLAVRLVLLVAIAGFVVGCSTMAKTTASSFMNEIEQSKDPNERFKAYEKLASDRCYDHAEQRARAVKLLVAALDENKEPLATRAVICRTLAMLGDPAARPPMLRMIRDNDLLIRTEAVRCLGRVGRPEDATVLMQIMTLDNNPDCQIAAIEALGTLKLVDPRTPGYLVKAMENDDPAIRLASYQSLKKITGKDLGVEVKVWREFLAKKEAADSRELANLPQLPGATVTLPQLPGASDTLPPLPGASSSGPRGRQAVQNPVLDASARPASSVYR